MNAQAYVFATQNLHKIREVGQILAGIELISLAEAGIDALYDEENGESFAENALIKAREAYRRTGRAAIADDSGIAVDYLGGAPGVHSARFAGVHGDDEANNRKLLSLLSGVSDPKGRSARFVCAAAAVLGDGVEIVTEGAVEGYIAFEPRGDGGFGYDPIFVEAASGVRFSEMPAEEKNAVSHRNIAFRALAKELEAHAGR